MDNTASDRIHQSNNPLGSGGEGNLAGPRFHQVSDSYLFKQNQFNSELIYRVPKAHSGAYLAACISECLHEYGIHNKVCHFSIKEIGCLLLIPMY